MELKGFTDKELLIGNMHGEARMIEAGLADDLREYFAITNVVMRRVQLPNFPDTIHDVVLQRNQFSWTREIDASLPVVKDFLKSKQPYDRYRNYVVIAEAVMNGRAVDFSNGADHYVAWWLYRKEVGEKADWIDKLTVTAVWGGHVFLAEKKDKVRGL